MPTLILAEKPAAIENGWDASIFAYERVESMTVEESTPSAEQVDWHRGNRIAPQAEALQDTEVAKPRIVDGMDVVRLRFVDADGDIVPALLCTPRGKTGPFPVVIATHGVRSNKAQVCAQVAPSLIKKGFAVLAADMPLHGERPGDPNTIFTANPVRHFELYRQAVRDVRQLIDLAQSRPELDAKSVTLVGYSMGSWISAIVGPADDRVRAMVLMVGGAREVNQSLLFLPQYCAVQPQLAIAHFSPRPILMLNGKDDYVVTTKMAKLLFAAAKEPKEQIWYGSGHLLPDAAYEKAAEWVAKRAN